MKRIFSFILLIIFAFILSACEEIVETNLTVEIDDIGLSENIYGVEFKIEFDNEEALVGSSPVSNVSILYSFKKLNKETLIRNYEKIILDTKDITLIDENKYTVSFDSENYKDDISLIIEVEFENEAKTYSNFVCVNIYKLAIKEENENIIAKEILDFYKIHNIDLDININHRGSLEGEGEYYTYTYSNPAYDKITIIVILREDLSFAEDFTLTIKGKNYGVKKGDTFEIKNNVLTYIFDDPNWTGIF